MDGLIIVFSLGKNPWVINSLTDLIGQQSRSSFFKYEYPIYIFSIIWKNISEAFIISFSDDMIWIISE